MITHIALLRAINVGGHAKLPMADLRAFFVQLGFPDAQTLLQTGNVVFGCAKKTGARLERLFESEAAKRLGLETAFMLRTAREWKALVAANPFPEMAARDPSHLNDGQAYVTYPDGIGTSRLTNAMLERALGTRSTGRNWNTVLKLAILAEAV